MKQAKVLADAEIKRLLAVIADDRLSNVSTYGTN